MPELPEVETVCRGLAKPLTGARITFAAVHRKDLRAPFPANLAQTLKGARINVIRRRAKYILIELDNNYTLLLHLGMSGRMVLSKQDLPLQKHDHLSLGFDNGFHARFNDPRRFGYCDLVETSRINDHKLLRSLGVEPLGDLFTPEHLSTLLAGRKTAIKTAIMDQRLIVGVGNIYACEALFRAKIYPERQAGKCTRSEVAVLQRAIQTVLNAAIDAGGSSLRDYVQADGELGYFQHHFAVYGREGKPCPECTCDLAKTHGVRRIAQAGRSTFYCMWKQKAASSRAKTLKKRASRI